MRVQASRLQELFRALANPRRRELPRGANLIAYLNAATGMGEAGRSTLRALHASGYPVWAHTVTEATSEGAAAAIPEYGPYPLNLFQVNADMAPYIMSGLGDSFLQGRKQVGFWMWEMTEFPEAWHDRFGAFHEIWVGSTHARDALQRIAPIRVHAMPLVVEPEPGAHFTRTDFSLPRDSYIFLFAFDALSVVERKNPFAVIEAYRLAFGTRSANTTLVIKVNNRALVRGDAARYLGVDDSFGQSLADAVANVGGILLDTRLDRARAYALIRLCDCYVSLHRCEGFGLTLAEAMYFGKPCIGTAFSANMDFMNSSNSYPVNYRLVELDRSYGPYQAGWTWAEPDVQEAAAWMEHVVRERDEAHQRGAQAARDVRATLNAHAVGARMVERLNEVLQ